MDRTVVIALYNNAALLLVLSVIYEVSYFIPSRFHRLRPIFSGFLIAGICTAIMSAPLTLQPGLVFDTRSILISVTALIFGPIPTAITVAVAVVFRLIIGGVGTLMGIAVIITSALIGLVWRQWLYLKSKKWCWLSVYMMSLSVHVAMIACMFLLPYPDNLNTIRQIALPVMLIYPVATVLLNMLLKRQQEIRNTQDQLKQSEETYRKITENISDVVWTIDLELKTIFVSPSIEQLVGESVQAHLKRPLAEKFPPDSLKKIRDILSEEMENDFHREKNRTRVIELEHYRADGTTRWLAMNISIIRDEKGKMTGFLGVSRDISKLKQVQDHLHYLIEHDDLTGIYNRRRFEKEIVRLDVAAQLPLSIIIADINGLKLINDSFGNSEGDKIIAQTAGLIGSCCREGDVLARTGGDEFSLLLPRSCEKSAIELIKTIQAACAQYNNAIANEANHINLSLGTDTKESINTEFIKIRKRAEDHMNQRKLLEKNSSQSEIISSIKATMIEKSQETEAHAERIAQLSKKIGQKLNLSQIELDHIELLATLHDIGKVGIDEHILRKPGKLDEDEWMEMKKHPEIGYRIAMSSPNLASVANYILSHHERWDGTGYPQMLEGEAIPLISRIITVVDAYDAMTEDRVYQKAITHDEAIKEIRRCSGTQFDPRIAQIFIELISS